MISHVRPSLAIAALLTLVPALARAQVPDTAYVDSLIRSLRSPARESRVSAAVDLQLLGRRAARAVPALADMAAHDRSAWARSKAVQALGGIGPAACSTLPTVLPLAHDRDPEIRANSVEALGGIGLGCGDASQDSAMVATVARTVKDPVSYVRYYALQSIYDFRQTSLLVDALRSRDDTIAARAARLLALDAPNDTVVNGLLAALADPRHRLREQAACSLGSFGAPVRAALVKASANPGSIRARAARDAIRYLDYASAAPVSGRCYRLEMTRWKPAMDLQDDTIYSTPPRQVRFTTVVMDVPSRAAHSFRVEPVDVPYSVHGPGYWSYSGDSIFVVWSTGFSGLDMRLRVASDTLVGDASTFWDFSRPQQTADVRAVAIPCGDLHRRALRRQR